MFYPATPGTEAGRLRLLLANTLLVSAAAGGALSALGLSLAAIRRRKWTYLLAPLAILLHPLVQPVFFERADTYFNVRWRDEVLAAKIVGKQSADVLALLGRPRSEVSEPALVSLGEVRPAYTIWRYKPLPFYWMGSSGEVVFVDGRVRNVEANDD
jgi:hypothetical protein